MMLNSAEKLSPASSSERRAPKLTNWPDDLAASDVRCNSLIINLHLTVATCDGPWGLPPAWTTELVGIHSKRGSFSTYRLIWLLRGLAAGIRHLDQAPAEDGILARRAKIDCRCRQRLGDAIGIPGGAFCKQRRSSCCYEWSSE